MKYLFIALIFISCHNISGNKNEQQIATEVLDTIQTSPPTITAEPAIFESAFVLGTTQKTKNSQITLYGVNIGKLKVSSGRLIACDPMHMDEYGKPFTQLFPTGEFPVQLAIANAGDVETIAFSRINFSDEPVARWEFALLEGQTQLPIGKEKMHGYSVDASVGAFIDEAAKNALDLSSVDNMDGALYKELDKHYRPNWRYAMYDFGEHNMAAFTSGYGDGYYATYIGFDAQGNPCRLLTDFGLFDWKGIGE
jgi:hypothetical protein